MRQLTDMEFDVLETIGFIDCNSSKTVADNLSFYDRGEIFKTVNNLHKEGFVNLGADGVFTVTEKGKAANSETPCLASGADCSLASDTPAPAAVAAAPQAAKEQAVAPPIEERQAADSPSARDTNGKRAVETIQPVVEKTYIEDDGQTRAPLAATTPGPTFSLEPHGLAARETSSPKPDCVIASDGISLLSPSLVAQLRNHGIVSSSIANLVCALGSISDADLVNDVAHELMGLASTPCVIPDDEMLEILCGFSGCALFYFDWLGVLCCTKKAEECHGVRFNRVDCFMGDDAGGYSRATFSLGVFSQPYSQPVFETEQELYYHACEKLNMELDYDVFGVTFMLLFQELLASGECESRNELHDYGVELIKNAEETKAMCSRLGVNRADI